MGVGGSGDVPCRDGVSSFDDDVHAVGEVGGVHDEAVFEGEGLVWRTHDCVTSASFSDWSYIRRGAYFMPERGGGGLRSKDRFSNSELEGSL